MEGPADASAMEQAPRDAEAQSASPLVRALNAIGAWAGPLPGIKLLIAAFLLRLWVARSATIIEPDGAYWAGRVNPVFRHGGGLASITAWPPLYPAAIDGVAWVLQLFGAAHVPATQEWAARLVSVIAGTLLLFPLAALGRRLLPEPARLPVILIAVVHPRLVEYSAMALSESLFTLLLVTGAAALASAWSTPAVEAPPRRPRLREWLAGATFGAAFLVRPEGLLLGLATWAFAVGFAARERARGFARLRPAFLAGLMLVCLPWLLVLRSATGEWTLGDKGPYNFWRAHREAHARHFPPPSTLITRVNRGHRHNRPVAPGEVRPLALLAAEPRAVLGVTARNFVRLVADTYPVTIGWPVAVLALAGLFVARSGAWWLVLVPMAAAPLLLAPITVDRRMLVPLVPFAILLAAAALGALARRRPGRTAMIVTAMLAIGLLVYSAGIPRRLDRAPEARAAGEWLEANWKEETRSNGTAPNLLPTVMARKPYAAFYAGFHIADLPDASPDSILADARPQSAYLIVDARAVRGDRPQLAPWLDPANTPPGWRAFHRIGGPDPLVIYVPDYSREGSIR